MSSKIYKALAHAYQEVINPQEDIQELQEAMDPVDPKELKGKHKDRKDKDLDNDGDVDKSDEYLHKRRKAITKTVKKSGEDDPKGESGETAIMNPKSESKSTTENVKSADKKPEVFVAPDGKKHTRMVPVDKEVIKKESTDMSIRDKLLSVLEKRDHGNTDMKQPHDDQDSPGAKKMRQDHAPEVMADIEKATDDNAKAEKQAKVSPKNPTDKNAPGDSKVINPVSDITQKGGFAQMVKSIADAYKGMK